MTAIPLASLFSLSSDILICFGVGLMIAVSLGFVAGYLLGKGSTDRDFRRAKKHLQNCFQHVQKSLETAYAACALLEKYPGPILTREQSAELNQKRSKLLDLVGRLVERKAPDPAAEPAPPKTDKKKLQEFPAMQWSLQPEQTHIKLPDASAFEANLEMMLLAGTETEQNSGLLLVQMNQQEQLKDRFGLMAPAKFMKTLSRLVLHKIRDEDVICVWKSDTLAVLFPGLTVSEGQACSELVRDAIRHHHFRLETSSPEVVVTASLAYITCVPGDSAELALERGAHALTQSQKQGRNQLIIQDSHSYEHKRAM